MQNRKRHRFIEQSFRLSGRRRGRDVLREQHQNMYTIKGETDYQPRLDACRSPQKHQRILLAVFFRKSFQSRSVR